MGYCRLLEVIGSRCSSTAIFVNAHHSIGMRALLLFGTDEQKAEVAARSGQRAQAGGVRTDRAGSRLRCRQRADDGHAVGGWHRLRAQRREAIHHQRGDRRFADRDGPHAGGRQRRNRRHGVCRHARYAGFRGRRTADGKAGRPRHGHGATGVPRHVRAAREHSRTARQGAEGGAHGARLRPHDVRRVLHGRRENLPAAGNGARPTRGANSVARWPNSSWCRRSSPTWPHGRMPWRR